MAHAAKLTRMQADFWVASASGPESGNGGRDGLGKWVCVFRGGVLWAGQIRYGNSNNWLFIRG